VVYDKGFFVGQVMTEFLKDTIQGCLTKIPSKYTADELRNINFRDFHVLTEVDLIVTGTNVTKHEPKYFSKYHTPEFPIADAVGISASLPLAFKPVHVEVDVPVGTYNRKSDDYCGYFVDGGVLNNFPIHAFDHLQQSISSKYPNLKPLHPNMLGLRLKEGPDWYTPPKKGGIKSPLFDDIKSYLFDAIGNVYEQILPESSIQFLTDFYSTIRFPSGEGQIRALEERDQIIDLDIYGLSLLDFAPSPDLKKEPIDNAYDTVLRYFEGPPQYLGPHGTTPAE